MARFKSQMLWVHHRGRDVSKFEALLLGGLGYAVVHSASAPLERVELLLRVKGELRSNDSDANRSASAYDGSDGRGGEFDPATAVECSQEIIRRDGWRGFWRGNAVAVARFFPLQA